MIIMIPLGGTGERFRNSRYTRPKAFILVAGKPILFHLLDHLSVTPKDHVYLVYHPEYQQYHFQDMIKHRYPDIHFLWFPLQHNTRGAADTIFIGLRHLDLEDQPILCLDADNFYTIDIVGRWKGTNCVFTFRDDSDPLSSRAAFSYVQKREGTDRITTIVEKERISNDACTGAYGFRSWFELKDAIQDVMDQKIMDKGEFYTSTVIRTMIGKGVMFRHHPISKSEYHCLGTPLQVIRFYQQYEQQTSSSSESKLSISPMRLCFDLDNTLVTFPRVPGDYTTVEPISRTIEFVRYMKSRGHTVIIHTARRMKTCHGNAGKVMANIGKITLDTLERFDIPYDEIYFGKPYADIYIDDLAVNCQTNLQKELGFYIDRIDPRSFHTLDRRTIETFRKSGSDLSGEIYYYRHIPPDLRDLFPALLDFDDHDHKWFVVEKVEGITISYLYVSEVLTEEILLYLLDQIHRIHSVTLSKEEQQVQTIDIYRNYAEKLQERYRTHDFSSFPNSDTVYRMLLAQLEEYASKDLGCCTVIHGDPVMTNMILTPDHHLKLIDMRGKLGSELTIYGDCFYDWAKIYQSLWGYDCLLLRKTISPGYETKMRRVFESFFESTFGSAMLGDLKILTKSLFFSLLPLHQDHPDVCSLFYEKMLHIV